MNSPEQNQNNLVENRYPLVDIVHPTIDPVAKTSGTTGYGEGFDYGTETFSKRPATYYYRFSGKRIPKEGITYVTSESGYFSRQKGDRSQLILAFDQDIKAFRVLASVPSGSCNFKDLLTKFQSFENNEAAIAYAQAEAEKIKIAADNMQKLIDSGADLF